MANNKLQELYSLNSDFVASAKKANKLLGLKKHFSNLYPDDAHFIYELLQNAEDTGANKVSFFLYENRLEFIHNGTRLFNYDDVEAITNISESTKAEDYTLIGKFGVGFKSVYAYTETPEIISGEYSFKIVDLFVPEPINNTNFYNGTKFSFPFNHPRKDKVTAYDEIKQILTTLNDNVILFLNNIGQIEWQIDNGPSGYITRLKLGDYHFEIEKKINNNVTDTHWLIFKDTYKYREINLPISIAFPMDFRKAIDKKQHYLFDDKLKLSEQMKIVTVNNVYQQGKLSVIFPCEKEEPKLNFHINGPFQTTPDRTKINYKDENKNILSEIGRLLVQSMEKIKQIGLLERSFLQVLPNSDDSLSDFFIDIFNILTTEMKERPIIPTTSTKRPFAPAKYLLNSFQMVKELLPEEDLLFLFGEENENNEEGYFWVDGVMIGGGPREERREERLLRDLEIRGINWDDLLDSFISLFYTSDEAIKWMKTKSDTWMQRFYLLLNDAEQKSESYRQTNLCDLPIIRTKSNQHLIASEVYFPTEKAMEIVIGHPVIKETVLFLTDTKKQKKLEEFFERLGVKQLGEEEQIKLILDKYYTFESEVPESESAHLKHLKKIYEYWLKNSYTCQSLVEEYYILCDKQKGYYLPTGLYMDVPYKKTNLEHSFKSIASEDKMQIWGGYKNYFSKEKSKFVEFILAIGVWDKLEIAEINIPTDHPDYSNLTYAGSVSRYQIDEDYNIEMIDELLSKKDLIISKIIWETMSKADSKVLKARFRTNNRSKLNESSSSLVYKLRESPWIPDKNNVFRRPYEITEEELFPGFEYNDTNGWLSEVQFGEGEERKSEELQRRKEILRELKISEQEYEEFLVFKLIPPEKRRNIIDTYSISKPNFPSKQSINNERRSKKIQEEIKKAPLKEYEKKERQIRISDGKVKEEAHQYLMTNYTNDDGQLICQICHNEMPFKLDNDEYYFESVPFIREEFDLEIMFNYLALCPTCAAKFEYANPNKDKIKSLFTECDDNELSISLARKVNTIRFVEKHFADLKTCLEEIDRK